MKKLSLRAVEETSLMHVLLAKIFFGSKQCPD